MNDVKVITLSLCVAVVVFSSISMIIPNEKNGKIIKMILSIFILICLISPFTKLVKGDFKYIYNTNTQILEENICNILNDASNGTIYSLLKTPIENYGIVNDFYIDSEVEYKNNSAIFKEINIYFIGDNNIEKSHLEEYIKKSIGINVNIK